VHELAARCCFIGSHLVQLTGCFSRASCSTCLKLPPSHRHWMKRVFVNSNFTLRTLTVPSGSSGNPKRNVARPTAALGRTDPTPHSTPLLTFVSRAPASQYLNHMDVPASQAKQ